MGLDLFSLVAVGQRDHRRAEASTVRLSKAGASIAVNRFSAAFATSVTEPPRVFR
jgi:hypothetical protein